MLSYNNYVEISYKPKFKMENTLDEEKTTATVESNYNKICDKKEENVEKCDSDDYSSSSSSSSYSIQTPLSSPIPPIIIPGDSFATPVRFNRPENPIAHLLLSNDDNDYSLSATANLCSYSEDESSVIDDDLPRPTRISSSALFLTTKRKRSDEENILSFTNTVDTPKCFVTPDRSAIRKSYFDKVDPFSTGGRHVIGPDSPGSCFSRFTLDKRKRRSN